MKLDMHSETMLSICELTDRIGFLVDDLTYILSAPNQRFCGGEREMAVFNLELLTEVHRQMKRAKIG